MFLGPTGVGKTFVARVLSEFMFGSEDSMIKLDMSEFMEKHNVSRLIGAPPGYVGYEDAGQLTDTVRRKSYCLVLLDEIEKAHPEVFNILLQIFDDGHLTDAKGRKGDFRNTGVLNPTFQMELVRKQLALKAVKLEMTDGAKDWIGEKGYDPVFGARPLRRVIQNEIEDSLSEALLEGRFSEGDTVRIDVQNEEIILENASEPALT